MSLLFTSTQLAALRAVISSNSLFTCSTWSITISQKPARSSLVVGNGSSEFCACEKPRI